MIAKREQAEKLYAIVTLIKNIPTLLIAKYFHSTFLEDLRYERFPTKFSWRASSSFRWVRGKRERQDIHPFASFPPPSPLLDPLGSKVVTSVYVCICVCVCVECFYSITPAARRHPLNHLLNPRPSALSPARSRLMAFENSNIICRSILSPLRTGTPQGP